MTTDKASRTRKPGNSKASSENPVQGDSMGIEGNEGNQVVSLLTGSSRELGTTTRSATMNGKHIINPRNDKLKTSTNNLYDVDY